MNDIRKQAEFGVDRATLAEKYDVTSQTILDVVERKSWKHLPSKAASVGKAPRAYNTRPNSGSFKKGSAGNPGPKPEKRTIDYSRARVLYSEGLSIRKVAKLMNTTHTTVRRAVSN